VEADERDSGCDRRARAAEEGGIGGRSTLFVVMSNAQCGYFTLIMTILSFPHRISNPS
jgi:hypothetical protein